MAMARSPPVSIFARPFRLSSVQCKSCSLQISACVSSRRRARNSGSLPGAIVGVWMFIAMAATFCGDDALAYISNETFNNIPRNIQGSDKRARIQKPISPKAERCTQKCVSTCIAGGAGGPGEGPLNIRRPLVVFKEGFRSRKYCLVECSDICNLIGNRDDGP